MAMHVSYASQVEPGKSVSTFQRGKTDYKCNKQTGIVMDAGWAHLMIRFISPWIHHRGFPSV
jgi:hypothetical protein